MILHSIAGETLRVAGDTWPATLASVERSARIPEFIACKLSSTLQAGQLTSKGVVCTDWSQKRLNFNDEHLVPASSRMNISTAGRGDPYWYEWTVGLLSVVELLDSEGGIDSVTFQAAGIKGWDDVVVRYADRRQSFYQVKHSRVGDSLTFGDLVGSSGTDPSLLASLFTAWREMTASARPTTLVLFTNRDAGSRSWTSPTGAFRPALIDFWAWLQPTLQEGQSLADCSPPPEWHAAWEEWIGQLSERNEDEQLNFLRQLELRAGQGELAELQGRLLVRLSELFQIPPARAVPFHHALSHALQEWSTGKERVTVEDVAAALALRPEPIELSPIPPPPAPFFPSRQPAVRELENLLVEPDSPPIIFLSAEVGEGKTSVISQLTNRRVHEPLTNVIGLRYFCFQPITPEVAIISPDADPRVRPEKLWFSLLSQLREGLRGRLRHFRVPLRNDLLNSWPEARDVVLRIASALGEELGRAFVIVIDGIDHAARASQIDPVTAQAFFASLPGPDALAGKRIRFLIAGQPSRYYQQFYPAWLQAPHPKVRVTSLGQLGLDDVRLLFSEANQAVPSDQIEHAVRLIHEATGGNTLATVFAVAEAQSCPSLEELSARLENHQLSDGLQSYYDAIWRHAVEAAGTPAMQVEPCVTGAFCYARERITTTLLGSAFTSWNLPDPWWRIFLARISPLIVEEADGFRVRHNDVRVFLAGRFTANPEAEQQAIASQLANHYLKPESNRVPAHLSVFALLDRAGRIDECPRVFTVDWVFEGGAFDIPSAHLLEECAIALRTCSSLRDWNVASELACATQTLERLEEVREQGRLPNAGHSSIEDDLLNLPSEGSVPPVQTWELIHLNTLLDDAERLVKASLIPRATALIERWFGDLSVMQIAKAFRGMIESRANGGDSELNLAVGADGQLKRLGKLCRSVAIRIRAGRVRENIEHEIVFHFEHGFVQGCCEAESVSDFASCVARRGIRYFDNFEALTLGLAQKGRWSVVRECLEKFTPNRDRSSGDFKARATYWALRADLLVSVNVWLAPLQEQNYGLDGEGEDVAACLAICRARGWREVATEPGTIADAVFRAFDRLNRREKSAAQHRLIFRAAAMLGRIESVQKRRGWKIAADVITPGQTRELLSALWRDDLVPSYDFRHQSIALDLAEELVEAAGHFGGAHEAEALQLALFLTADRPLDSQRGGVWAVMRRNGRNEALRRSLEHWIGPRGMAWTHYADLRDSIIKYAQMARDMGEHDLADDAVDRLRWCLITYRGHKEDAFGPAYETYELLQKLDPACWKERGLRLWALCDAASSLGADNHLDFEIKTLLGTGAFRCGPNDVWQQFCMTLPQASAKNDEWHHSMRNRFTGSFAHSLEDGATFSASDKVVCWCLAVGFSRWFDDTDVSALKDLREQILSSCRDENERTWIRDQLLRITPGEMLRQPQTDQRASRDSATETAVKEDVIGECRRLVDEGHEINPALVVRASREVLRRNDALQRSELRNWLSAVGTDQDYTAGWSHCFGIHDREAVLELATLVTDDELWALVDAAVRGIGRGSRWTHGIAGNLHAVTFGRAKARGVSAVRERLDAIHAMHDRWTGGGRRDIEFPTLTMPDLEVVATWEEVSLGVLNVLLGSRSAEVLSSASTGLHALVEHDPRLIPEILALASNDEWRLRWVLNAMESWAAIHPLAVDEVRPQLEELMKQGPLDVRLQVWVVLTRWADVQGRERPRFPMPTNAPEKSPILRPARAVMETEANVRGATRFVDRYGAVRTKLATIEALTGYPRDGVETDAAENLVAAMNNPNLINGEWNSPHRSGDMMCHEFVAESALGEALDRVLTADFWTSSRIVRLSQAFLEGEDPWIVRRTPLPSVSVSGWPTDDEVSGSYERPPASATIEQRLNLLATQHEVADDERVLAARAQVYSYREDFSLFVWWEETSGNEGDLRANGIPTCPIGRSFVSWMEGAYEPGRVEGERTTAFFTGGSQRLIDSFLQILPARFCRTELGWQPDLCDPLVWVKNGRPVARYQRLHGVPRHSHGPYHRQPLLDRWLVKEAAFVELLAALQAPNRKTVFTRHANSMER